MRRSRLSVPLTSLLLAAGLLATVCSAAADDARWALSGAQVVGTPDRPVWSLAPSLAHPKVVLAATQGRGVLRSTDGGATWVTAIAGIGSAWVVRFDPKDPETAYAGTQTAGLWRSADAGKTWTPINAGLDLDVRSIEIGAGLLLVGTGHGVYASKDAGATWQSLGLSDLDIASIAILPQATSYTIFAGADNGSSSGYLLRSEQLTGSWTVVHGSFPVDVTVAALAVGSAPAGGGPPPVLAGTSGGLYRSDDGGSSWSPLNGLPQTDVNVVLFNRANNDQLYAASDGDQGNGGVFRSLDRGSSWSPLGAGLPKNPRITALALRPVAPVEVLAGTWNPSLGQAGLYRIADPSATAPGGSPAPVPTASARPRPVPSTTPVVVPAAHSLPAPSLASARYVAAGAGALLLLTFLVLFRRWRLRREDRATYRR